MKPGTIPYDDRELQLVSQCKCPCLIHSKPFKK